MHLQNCTFLSTFATALQKIIDFFYSPSGPIAQLVRAPDS